MRKIVSVVSACVAVSTVLTMATTTFAATKTPASHTVSANQSLLNQIDALQKTTRPRTQQCPQE
ncbi:hypothetical protein GCM10025859_59380 [Alicyclobacillus fastidiosus]|nr:hypothetical protein GCM10025859_00110 [Alicyclobacillus fastidiosus]GMA65498.1 hypothetical protein GCM10025859_59380 [Alicyclobacillus fastidiosus]